MALPHGYDTEVGERGALLSAGERQLVAFARSWLADPTLLILDEATSNLDVATETRVTEAMRRLRQGRTTVVIAHRLSTVIDADQIAVIEDGRVVEAGPTDQLLTRAAASSPTCMTAGSLAPHDRSGVVLPSRWLGRIRLT
jgi:ABC-type multidrug transport system fused ATPase/permease subunit